MALAAASTKPAPAASTKPPPAKKAKTEGPSEGDIGLVPASGVSPAVTADASSAASRGESVVQTLGLLPSVPPSIPDDAEADAVPVMKLLCPWVAKTIEEAVKRERSLFAEFPVDVHPAKFAPLEIKTHDNMKEGEM